MAKQILTAWLAGLLTVAGLSGCASSNDPNPVPISEATGKSRIRIFGQNGVMADLYAGKACVGGRGVESISGGMGSMFGSFFGLSSNQSIGIPQTQTTQNLSQKSQFLSKAYYREYEIPGGTPTSLELGGAVMGAGSYAGYGNQHCDGSISFTPQAGEDYEVGFIFGSRSCQLTIYHIIKQEDGQTRLEAVPSQRAPKC